MANLDLPNNPVHGATHVHTYTKDGDPGKTKYTYVRTGNAGGVRLFAFS